MDRRLPFYLKTQISHQRHITHGLNYNHTQQPDRLIVITVMIDENYKARKYQRFITLITALTRGLENPNAM